MHEKDYYAILGLSENADENEIKTAYRKLALQNHPDLNPGDPAAEERFKEINEAYETLSNRDKRRQYDLGQNPRNADPFFHPSAFDPFETGIFSGLRCRGGGFGRGLGHKQRKSRNSDSAGAHSGAPIYELVLTAAEALTGTERDIRLHLGRDTLVFTVSIPPRVENHTLLHFKQPTGDGQEIQLQFRVRIPE
ncbi:MAG: J domain-containing protein [Desulfobacteraceae bacterium]|nr:MAG: J domain-containing protein [Desulfobacteraceae bacterium]